MALHEMFHKWLHDAVVACNVVEVELVSTLSALLAILHTTGADTQCNGCVACNVGLCSWLTELTIRPAEQQPTHMLAGGFALLPMCFMDLVQTYPAGFCPPLSWWVCSLPLHSSPLQVSGTGAVALGSCGIAIGTQAVGFHCMRGPVPSPGTHPPQAHMVVVVVVVVVDT